MLIYQNLLEADADELDIDKLKIASVDLSKISNIVKNDVVEKIVYDKG